MTTIFRAERTSSTGSAASNAATASSHVGSRSKSPSFIPTFSTTFIMPMVSSTLLACRFGDRGLQDERAFFWVALIGRQQVGDKPAASIGLTLDCQPKPVLRVVLPSCLGLAVV